MWSDLIPTNQDTWDKIAFSFDLTRHKYWPQCIDFINSLPGTSFVADIGCGNGRHLIPCAQHCQKIFGIDISINLLRIVEKKVNKLKIKNVGLFNTDVTAIPFKENSFDVVLYIAALHNIKGKTNRINSLKEIKRILKRDKLAMISIWSRWQDKYRKMFFKKWFTQVAKEEFGDIDIYWKQHGLNIPRFYHLYSKQEFISDLKTAGLRIIEIKDVKLVSKKYPDNYFAIVQKEL